VPSQDASTQLPARLTTTAAGTQGAVANRDGTGRFVKGVSGNPTGVSKDLLPRRKEQILRLKENLDYAVRGPAGPLSADRVCAIVRKMCDLAMQGDVKAARLVLGIAISSANAQSEDKNTAPPALVIKVENATFSAVKQTAASQPPIDGEYTETSNE